MGSTKQRKRQAPRGRVVDENALAEVTALVGAGQLRHDLLIEYLHLSRMSVQSLIIGAVLALLIGQLAVLRSAIKTAAA